MKYLLDTDHLSILQRQAGRDLSNLSTRMAQYPLSDFAVSTVTFHEQMTKMDARIGAIAMFRGLILLTRNHRDFGKVTGLLIEESKIISSDVDSITFRLTFELFSTVQDRWIVPPMLPTH